MKLRRMVSAATAGLLVFGLSIAVVPPALAADSTTPGAYNPVTATRVLDTRSGIGAPKASVAPLGTLTFTVPDASSGTIGAALLEVTVVNPTAPGYATVYPAGTSRPVVSNVNFQLGQNVPNMVTVRVGTGNKVSIFNGSKGTVDLLADVQGYFLGGANAGDPGTLVPIAPARYLDTRSGVGIGVKGKVAPRSITKVKVAGRGNVPANASAVAVNITAVGSLGKGFITAYPGDPLPTISTVNFEAKQDRANLALSEVGADGTISLYNGSPFPVDVLADVSGYFVGGGTAAADGSFTPGPNVRAVDTRSSGSRVVPALATVKIALAPDNPLYAEFIKAVAVNITVANPLSGGFLTTWDGTGGTTVPAVSNVNFQAGHDSAGSIVVPINSDGTFSIYNGSLSNIDLLVDVNGLFFRAPDENPTRNSPQAAKNAPTAIQLRDAIAKYLSTPHPLVITRSR